MASRIALDAQIMNENLRGFGGKKARVREVVVEFRSRD